MHIDRTISNKLGSLILVFKGTIEVCFGWLIAGKAFGID